MMCVSPRDDGTVLLHCGEGVPSANHMIDTVSATRTSRCRSCRQARSISPCDDGTVLLHCGEGTHASSDVANTAIQLIPDLIGVASSFFIAPFDNGTAVLHCGEGVPWTETRSTPPLSSDFTLSELPPSKANAQVTTEPSCFTAAKENSSAPTT